MLIEDELNQQPVTQIPVSLLGFADSPRQAGEDPEHVETLAAAQGPLPPIIVHRPSMRVIDGMHRLRAAISRGDEKINVRFFDGCEADAFVLAVKLNITHGLPLALADRKRAAERIVASQPTWSDRRIAAVTGISPGTVADIRRCTGVSEPVSGRVGQDGRVRPLDPRTGRQLAGDLISKNPNLSLRQVARAAAISPETVRDVRNRLRNGESLIPGPRREEIREPSAAVTTTTTTKERGKGGGSLRIAGHHMRAAVRNPVPDRATVVNRLKADPALRYNETGRNLLRLLALHMQWTDDWEAIIGNLPPHCSCIVADLAQQFADLWTDLATRAVRDAAA